MQMKMLRFVLVVLVVLNASNSYATPAKVFSIKKQNPVEIPSDKGHIDMTFVTGWISNKDTLISKLLSSNQKLAANASATGTYFDGDQLKNSWIVENTDVPHTFDRPWGIANKPLLSAIPADTLITSITLQMGTYREDRFKSLITAFQSSEPATGLAVEPYLTYAKMVDGFLSTLFGTDKTKYPFTLDAGLVDANTRSANGLLEHYIVAISPNANQDRWLEGLDGTKLAYDPAGNRLTYNGDLVTDHTFVILWVSSAQAPDITKLLFNSKAAWAVLALTNFYNATLPEIASNDDVPKVDKAFVPQLAACVDQLKRELRFSAYDRAVALRAFAERSKQMVAAACNVKNIAAADCKTPQIQSYEDGIDGIFGIKNDETKSAESQGVQQLNQQIQQMLQDMNPK
jgi:hypothetical protein